MNALDGRVLSALLLSILWTVAVGWFFFGGRRRVAAQVGAGGVQSLEVVVKGGYSPDRLVVQQGRPVRLRFTRRETADCSSRVVFPDLGINKRLPANDTTEVLFTPDKAGEFPFMCGMGMYRGKLIVEPAGRNGTTDHHH